MINARVSGSYWALRFHLQIFAVSVPERYNFLLSSAASAPTRQCRLQTRPALTRNPMPVDVHGHRDRAVAELFLNIGRAHPRHEKDRGIGVPQVVGVSDLKPGGLAGPPELALNIPLAERGSLRPRG